MDKISLEKKLILMQPNEILDNNCISELISDYSDLNNLILLLDLNRKDVTKFLFFIRHKVDTILYNEDENININSLSKYDLSYYFYLDMLVNEKTEVINYIYRSNLIINLNNHNKKELNPLNKLVISKIILDLINNYINFENEDENIDEEEIKTIETFNKSIINDSKNILQEFDLNLEFIFNKYNKIDNFYSKIINQLIITKKFEDYDYAYNILNQLDLENIDITKKMFDVISYTLNINNEYIKEMMFSKIDDLFNVKKINFYYLLMKYIIKSSIYIYYSSFLSKARTFLIFIINKKLDQLLSFNISNNIKENNILERQEYVLKTITDSEYYYTKYMNGKLKIILNYYKECLFESKEEEIEKLKKIIKNNKKCKYEYYFKDYNIAREIMDRIPVINFLYVQRENEILKTQLRYQLIIEEWKGIEKAICEREYSKINNDLKRIIYKYFSNKNNEKILLNIFKKEDIYKNFIKENRELKDNESIIRSSEIISLRQNNSINSFSQKSTNDTYITNITHSSFSILSNNCNSSVTFLDKGISSISFESNNYSDSKNNNKLRCSLCKKGNAVNACLHCSSYFCLPCSIFIFQKQIFNHILMKIPEAQNQIYKEEFENNYNTILKQLEMKCKYLMNLADKNITYPKITDIYNFDSQLKYLEEINNLYNNNISPQNSSNLEITSIIKNNFTESSFFSNIPFINNYSFFSDKTKELDEGEYNSNRNKFFYFINVVPKESGFDANIIDIISKKLSSCLSIDKDNVFFLYNDNVNNFVKSKNFSEIYFEKLKSDNKILDKLYESKKLIDLFLNEKCQISNCHLDYRGNLLMPDISGNLLREKKSNDLPFGWIGIGLNVLGKYDNDDWLINNTDSSEWVTAYYGIAIDSIFEFRNLIQNIIMKKGMEESEESSSLTDSNLSDKKYIWEMGKDVCLTPSIKNAENDAKKISIDNKEYKIVFMEKVFKNGIKEADRTDYWIVDNKNVRIYRILFKEITLNISYNKYLEEQLQ